MLRLVFTITIMLLSVSAYGQVIEDSIDATDSTAVVEMRAIVRCERVTVPDMRIIDTLDITVETIGMQTAGFDLKFGTDSRFFEILEVLPGRVVDSCGWEYFSAYQVRTAGKEDLPRSLWQAVALAKTSPDSTRVGCDELHGENSLVRLVVSNESLAEVPDTTAPIFFFWEDCSDNSLSDQSGSSLLISSNVYDYFGVELSEGKDMLPTRKGTPRQCVSQRATNQPKRVVDFHNGGVEFKLDIGEETAEPAGE